MKKICICLILALLSIINASAIYVDDIEYYLYSDGTARCVLPYSNGTYYESIRYKNELVIQPVVTYNGKEYRVTRLSNPSFKEDENSTFSPEVAFKSVKIPCGIEIYNPRASSSSPIRQFSRLVYKNLKVLYFVPDGVHCHQDLNYPKTLKFVGFAPEVSVIASHLLTYNENLQKIVLLNPLPPAIGYKNYTTDFSYLPFEKVARKIMREATLYIPKGSLEKYSRDPIWGCFLNIEEIDVDTCDFDSLANEKCKYRVDTNAVACNSFVWKNETYTESGNYEKLYTAKNGCDSIVTLHLTINKPKATDVYKTVETSYNWDGDEYSLSGEYNKTYTAKNGCDSIVTLHLTIAPPIEQNISVTAFGSYTWNRELYKTSGVYVKHFETPTGNDSTVTLNLTIYDTPHNEITVKTGGSYIWGGASYSQSGDYQRTFAASCGCDSIVTLHLTIIPPVEKEISATACGGYEWNNKTYTESGDYQSSFRLKNGNDSIVTLHLTINKPVYKEISKTASNSYTWDGTVYKKSGNYTNTYTAKNGCDSVVTLHLTIDGTYIIDSSDDNEGTVTIDGDAGIGKTVVITAEPKEGHRFKQWSDGYTENPRTVTITDGMNLKAEYELEVYTIQVSSNNSNYGNAAGNGDYEYGSTAFIMASPNNGYKFVKWNDGNTAVIRTIKVKKDSAFVAEFAEDESAVAPSTPTGSYTIGAADPDGGSVSVDGEAGIGKTVTLTATPKDGYKFKQWSDGNTENPRTVTITNGMNLKAEFEAYERTWKLNALEWNEDSTKVTVYFYCPEDGKTKSVEAKPVVVEQAATCHEKGSKKRVVTVAFEGQIYEESEETVVDAPRQNIVKKMWGDVLTVVDPNKEFIQYEWYRNGEFVSNKAYVSEAGGLTGEYTLQVTKRDGSKVCSNTVTMSEKRSSAALRVYPNPATDNVTIEGDFEEGSEIRIVDMNGVLVKKTKAATDGRATVMTSGMTAGAYTVIAGDDTARLIKK